MKKTDSLAKRYLFKLLTSFLVIPLNLFLVSILTKELGPEIYGDFKYIIYSFTLFVSVISFGGSYFNTELSKNHYNKKLISFYYNFSFFYWILSGIFLFLIIYFGLLNTILNSNISISLICFGFFYSMLLFISSNLESVTDSCGLSKNASIFNFLSKFFGLLFLLILFYWFNFINVYSVFFYYFFVFVIASLSFLLLLNNYKIPIFKFSISIKDFKTQFKPFADYSYPIFLIVLYGFFTGFLNRSILQSYGGSIEQGYFSFSDTISAFIIIFSNSITPLLLREFSISHNEGNTIKLKNTFKSSLLLFASLSVYFCAFIFYNVEFVTEFIAGESFNKSIVPTKIMLLYPVLYVMINILNTVMYSLAKTKALKNIILFIGLIQLILTIIFVTPINSFGLALGAIGFSISLVISTSVNFFILLFYCTNYLNLKFANIIFKILKIIIFFFTLSYVNFLFFNFIIYNTLYAFVISGIFYSLTVIIFFYKFPYIFGIEKDKLDIFVIQLKKNFN